MSDWYDFSNNSNNGGGGRRLTKEEDFEEEDVWSIMKEPKDFSSSSSSKHLHTSPRMIPKSKTHDSKTSKQSSAPLKIPEWSQIYCNDDHDDGDNDDEIVPPHEWIAKKLERNKISSFSMCEGIGRTLKGRDLSKVRNAVLTKTGFLEQS